MHAATHQLMDRQTDSWQYAWYTQGPEQSPSVEQHREENHHAKGKGSGKGKENVFRQLKATNGSKHITKSSLQQGLWRILLKSLLSSAKSHFIQVLQHPGACSMTVVSSWGNTAVSSLFPEPSVGWRTRGLPEPALSAASLAASSRGQC